MRDEVPVLIAPVMRALTGSGADDLLPQRGLVDQVGDLADSLSDVAARLESMDQAREEARTIARAERDHQRKVQLAVIGGIITATSGVTLTVANALLS